MIAAKPDTPLSSILSPKVMEANPQLANQTAGGYMAGMTSEFGAAPIGSTAPARTGAAVTGGRGWQILTDPTTKQQYRYNPTTAISTTLDGQPYTPGGAAKLDGGGNHARSAVSMAVSKYVEENPKASAQDIANFAAQYQRTVTAGTADVKAEAAGLQNLGKMKASVAQAEGNAKREADLVLSLTDKGAVNGEPQMFNKWAQAARKGVFNSEDVSKFQTAVESFKNEYVKVLSTTGGMAGGMSSDAARREADQYINPNLTAGQIKANIGIMKQSMANRTAAIEQAYGESKERVAKAGAGPDKDKDAAKVATPQSKDDYDALASGAHYSKPGDAPGTFRVKP